ncbi:DUF885 domain-containing protein [Pseudoalteromonas citrea]|uniref:DUF885 domain-containing protein n=1 Tax=Pseudoalteromonas citrea TaxID=43655 RepID=A0A5S3XMY6_9GAMM|nr:DUF885 domain-containing protein [Pseudoalteromonas citrea]TMP42794.1 DUF885 domain-containing protein [Pseudoalteromonas citrea]TMP56657.1 DUF885 domain-containing protein [Pseudoalteromonas citrea]
MIIKTITAATLLVILSGCQTSDTRLELSQENNTSVQLSANEQMKEIAQSYFDDMIALSPVNGTFVGYAQYNDEFQAPSTPASRSKYVTLVQGYQSKLRAIDKTTLTGQSLISYNILARDLAFSLAGTQFPSYLIPINQMFGAHNTFASLGSGASAQPFSSAEDYDNFIARAKQYVIWLDGVEQNMREGIKQGVVLPKVLSAKLLPQFTAHIVDDVEQSVFWQPITNLPNDSTQEQKQHITSAYRNMIEGTLVPAYKKMAKFLETEYLPNSRSSVGLGSLPNGKAWYEYNIEKHTTMKLTAEEIHQTGLSEVKRIRNEMNWVKEQLQFEGDLQAFFVHLRESDEFYFNSPEELISAYEKVKRKIDKRVPILFDIKPKADYVVKAVESFRAESAAGASYSAPAPDGSRPGIFYINTHNLKAQPKFLVETLSIHEAAPGHHFQIALQQEIKGVPMFRKFGGYTVFSEGWALYAESLGKELGLFTDPLMWYGRLVDEQLRAMRLVVDTGLHAKNWSREQAITFMINNSSMAESDVVAEVERYIAWPGQAVSYKIGQFKIQELKGYAQKALGERFDVKAFHRQILTDGAVPMAILERKIKAWVASQA